MTRDFEDHCWKDIIPQDEIEIYRSFFAREPRPLGPNPALIAIDLYKKVYAGGPGPVAEINKRHRGACGDHAWNAIPPTRTLFAACREAGMPIFYTTGRSGTGVVATNRQRSAEEEAKSAEGYEILDDFAPQPGDSVIFKERASGFFGTSLTAQLKMRGIDSVILIGESTSGCLRASVVDAFSYGFQVAVVEECCFDRSMTSHKVALFDLHHKYAEVMHLEDILPMITASGRSRAAAE